MRRIIGADPGGTPGGVYQQPRVLAAAIVNADQMTGQPLALALALGAAALVSLSAAVAASARRRRSNLAVLQTLGLNRVVSYAASSPGRRSPLFLIAGVVGLPLGIVTGRLAWAGFATSLGVVPVTVVPLSSLVVGLLALAAAGALFMCSRFFSQGGSTASSLRSE